MLFPNLDEKRLKNLCECQKRVIQRIGERAITIDDYAYNFERIFSKMDKMDKAISFKKK